MSMSKSKKQDLPPIIDPIEFSVLIFWQKRINYKSFMEIKNERRKRESMQNMRQKY